jgi:hypothetical protein
MLGKLTDEKRLSRIAGTHWWSGTNEIRLSRAARANDCDLLAVRKRSPDVARKELIAHLNEQTPVILCVDDWGHWITVVRHDRSGFVVLDSSLDPVLNILPWGQLNRRWRYLDRDYDADDPPALYDLYVVQPRFPVTVRASFGAARVRFLRRPENRRLAHSWDEYLEDLLAICRPPSKRLIDRLSMAEFLRRNQDLILSRVTYWHGSIDRKALGRLLRNFRFVAETYGLVIPTASSRQAVADIAILATLWATANRGVGDLYGASENGD